MPNDPADAGVAMGASAGEGVSPVLSVVEFGAAAVVTT